MFKDRDAVEIADEFLYLTGKYFWAENFEDFREFFALPYHLETADGARVIGTEFELRELFAKLREYYRKTDIFDFARTVISAEFLDETTIGSTHVSNLLGKSGKPVKAPYPCYSIIKKTGDRWKIFSSIYAILDNPELAKTLTLDTDRISNNGT